MRKKVDMFAGVMKQARRDKEGSKSWKESFGGATEEEKKVEEPKKIKKVLGGGVFQ